MPAACRPRLSSLARFRWHWAYPLSTPSAGTVKPMLRECHCDYLAEGICLLAPDTPHDVHKRFGGRWMTVKTLAIAEEGDIDDQRVHCEKPSNIPSPVPPPTPSQKNQQITYIGTMTSESKQAAAAWGNRSQPPARRACSARPLSRYFVASRAFLMHRLRTCRLRADVPSVVSV